jgi:hypothetical protein
MKIASVQEMIVTNKSYKWFHDFPTMDSPNIAYSKHLAQGASPALQ